MAYRLLLALLLIAISGCSGMGAPYETPTEENQIPFSVAAVTPTLVSGMALESPSAATPPAGTTSRAAYAYRVGPADVLSLYVNQPLFDASQGSSTGTSPGGETQAYVVSERGQIFLPLHGPLEVAGLTISEIYESVQQALGAFIAQPQINISVSDFRSQYATVVSESGIGAYLPVTDKPMTIVDAVIQASPSESPDLRNVTLKRDGRETSVDVAALLSSPHFGADWLLQHGDVVLVPENSNGVYLLGEAPNQRRQIDPYSTSLAEVLLPQLQGNQVQQGNQRGGFLNSGAADIGSIFVIRGDTSFAKVFHLNARSPDSMLLAEAFPMQDGDIVFVTTRNVTRFNRYVAELLPSLAPLLLAQTVFD